MIKYPDKDKILEEFKVKYVDNNWVKDFIRIDEFYRNNKDDIDTKLIEKFNLVCEKCISMQKDNLKGQVAYIYFSFLRSSIIKKKGEVRIDLYDENWFLDKQECSINIELDFLYNSLFELESNLKNRKMEYGRTITDMDVEYIILDEADKYHILAVEFLKQLVSKFIEFDSYKIMKKSSNIKILAGELMDSAEIIYENN
ncbi:hypothetical protein [Clostridium weizhouense]|uniref:Uncharacterized protein n=1 Tax=Clostridium weizhouense TaxID=2859781 RepID=A0ABS7ALZ5_9CLOT|nr:hypothetical protein [Clostridium weizhouense]MBW6409682.1 hypothetical protein [Clostridium weizhouense]